MIDNLWNTEKSNSWHLINKNYAATIYGLWTDAVYCKSNYKQVSKLERWNELISNHQKYERICFMETQTPCRYFATCAEKLIIPLQHELYHYSKRLGNVQQYPNIHTRKVSL